MSRVDILVAVIDTESGWTFTRVYSTSPVRIGKSSGNDLRLPGPAVAAEHGELVFGPESLTYRNLARKKASCVEGARVKPGSVVALSRQSVVTIGPYRVEALVRPVDDAAPGLRLELRPHEQGLAVAGVPMADAPPRALETLAIFSSGFCGLKRCLIARGTSPLYQLHEPAEILEYLLDPTGPDSRLDELREAQRMLVARVADETPSVRNSGDLLQDEP